jgi:hypothetical protein
VEPRTDLWHLAFANLIQHRAPPNFEVQTEVRLTIEPQRADMLLLRRIGGAAEDDKAEVLRMLWPRLGLVTVLEFKSPIDSSFRPGDLLRLLGYGVLYDTAHIEELPGPQDLTLALVVASITPTLLAEIARMGWTCSPLLGGYGRIDGAVYTIHLVVTDEVTEAERDEYLRLFSHRKVQQGEATRWLRQWMKETKMTQPNIDELPEFEEMFKKTIDKLKKERLEKLSPEERLEGLAPEQVLGAFAPEQIVGAFSPEQRLAGLSTEHLILALPVDVLRLLPEQYLRSLPPEVQEKIQQRLRGAAD